MSDDFRVRRELAIRAALGAGRPALRSLVLQEGYRLIAAGLALGMAGALLLGFAVAHLLIAVPPYDPGAFLLGALTVVTITAVAIWIPAHRAGHANPIGVLRAD